MTEKKLSRRDFLRIASLAAAGGVLAACTTPTPQIVEVTRVVEKEGEVVEVTKEVIKEVTKEVVEKEEVEVTREIEVGLPEVTVLINGNLLTEADALSEGMLFTVHLMDYNLKDNKRAMARYEAWPGGDEYNTKIRLMTASGEMKNVCVWGNWSPLPAAVNDGLLLPLDDLMDGASVAKTEWLEPAVKLLSYDPENKKTGAGSMWALSIMGNPGACFLFTNVDMVNAAGAVMPTDSSTLLDLEAAATKIAKPDSGIFGMQNNLWGTTHGFSWDQGYLAPFGADVLNEDGTKCLIDSDAALKAYTWYYENRHVRRIEGTPDDVTAYGNYKEGSEKGKVAMYKMGPWGAGWFLLKPENKDPVMTYTLYPTSYDGTLGKRRGNTLGMNWYGISANATDPEACFDVLYWFNNYEAGIASIEFGQTTPPPREDVLTDPILDDYPFIKSTAAAIMGSEVERVPANNRTAEASDLLAQRMTTFDTGENVPSKAFLEQLAGEIQAILDMDPA